MYVCMHVCMYICMYTYTEFFFSRAYTFGGGSTLCVCERESVCVCMRQHARMCVSLSLCASCLSIYLFICWFSYVFIYLFIYLPTFEEGMRDMEWLHTHTHTHTYKFMCKHIYPYIPRGRATPSTSRAWRGGPRIFHHSPRSPQKTSDFLPFLLLLSSRRPRGAGKKKNSEKSAP